MNSGLNKLRWLALILLEGVEWYHFSVNIPQVLSWLSSPLEDMSHGYVVPIVSLVVLWQKRGELRERAGGPCWSGFAWVVGFLLLAWFGSRGGQSRIELVALIGLIWAGPYALWGRGVARVMRFPAGYLLFTVPVSSFIDFFTIHLRIFSTVMATGILNGIGLSVERSGTALFSHVPDAAFNVDVADPCSGIRSLFAMMALTAVYAYFTQKEGFRKWMLFACALPIAVIGNMVRIMSICLVAMWFGQETATGYYHDYSGYVVFLVGVLLMFQAGEWIKKWNISSRVLRCGSSKVEECGANNFRSSGPPNFRTAFAVVVGVIALSLALFVTGLTLSAPAYDTASFVASSLPVRIGEFGSDVPWFCQHPQCLSVVAEQSLQKGVVDGKEVFVCPACGGEMHAVSLGEKTDLPKDTAILKRNYRSADGLQYAVSVVIAGRNRGSLHRAELCLPAQGYTMLDAGRVPLRLADGQTVTVRKLDAQHSGAAPICLLYWFLSRERTCCSHTQRILTDVWDRSIHNRINRWVMVAVNVSSGLDSPESVERFEAFLAEFYPQVILGR
jgi:exosortase